MQGWRQRINGRLAFTWGVPGVALLGATAAVAAWKAHHLMLLAGNPSSGEALAGPQQLIAYGLALTWRALGQGLAMGAAGCLLAVVVALLCGRDRAMAPQAGNTTSQSAAGKPWLRRAARPELLAAAIGFLYALLHRQIAGTPTMGDEASYVERGRQLAVAVGHLSFGELYRWLELTGHRPWPGLAPVYAGSLLQLSVPVLVGLQGAAAWAFLAFGLRRLGRTLGLEPVAVAMAFALVVTQSLWRIETTTVFADAMLTGAVALAIAQTVAFLELPSAATCWRAGLAIGLAPAMKPGGVLWSVVPLSLAAGAWLVLLDRRGSLRQRLGWLADLAAVVAVATTVALLLGGGPKAWLLIGRHGLSVEGLGYYDESIQGAGQHALWLLLALARLSTVPLLALAAWGAWRARPALRLTALVALLMPLSIHAFAMESKSLRLIGAALAPLAALAAAGAHDLWRRRAWSPTWAWTGVVVVPLVLFGVDLTTPTADLTDKAYLGPVTAGDWRQVQPSWLGANPVGDFASLWHPAAVAIDRAVGQHCKREATTPLYLERRLVVDARDSGYSVGLTPRSHYVPELQTAFAGPMLEASGCLVTHTGNVLSWEGGHGRLHGEGLVRDLARTVQDRNDPLAQAFAEVARVNLPDGHAVVVWRRVAAADLAERVLWAERLATWMPGAGVWSELWWQVAQAQAAAGQPRAAVCKQLQRAAAARPMRGLVPCERIDPSLCLAATVPARAAASRAHELECPVLPESALWPDGMPPWVLRAAVPRPG